MNSLTHWTDSPLGLLSIVVLLIHEVGIARLRSRSAMRRPARAWRAWAFRLGILAIVISTLSPLGYYGTRELTVHMVDHLVLLFFAPAALVSGGPIVPICWALPVGPRRHVLRWLCLGRPGALLGAAWRFATAPVVGFIAMNAAMFFWHVPGPFDAAARSNVILYFCQEPSFVLAGLLFWPSILSSHPYRPRAARLRIQLVLVVASNAAMVLLAMSMSIFTNHAWYTLAPMPGHGSAPVAASLSAQQTAAAVLWICGDFWALPTIILIAQRLIKRDGSVLAALDRRFDRFGDEDDDLTKPQLSTPS